MKKEGLLFSLLLIFFVSLILFKSVGFTEYQTKLMPILVGTATLVLGLGMLMGEIFPRFRKLFDVQLLEMKGVVEEEGQVGWSEKKGFLIIFPWLLLFSLLSFFLGFYVAVSVCIILFTKFYGNQSWAKSLMISAITLIFIYGIFQALMGIGLFKGIVFGEIL